MKRIASFLFAFALVYPLFAGNISQYFTHNTPNQVLLGDKVQIELLANGGASQAYYNGALFFRMQGEEKFKSIHLRDQGYLLSAEIPTSKLRAGKVEYYFAFQSPNGGAEYFPESSPSANFQFEIIPSKKAGNIQSNLVPVTILAPETNESLPADEFFVAISIPLDIISTLTVEDLEFKLFINGIDVSSALEIDGNLITFEPRGSISGSRKNIEFRIKDRNGNVIAEKEWAVRVTAPESKERAFNPNISISLDNRYMNIGKTTNNIFRGRVTFYGNYKKLDFIAKTLISSEENSTTQAINRYGLELQYNFTPLTNIYVKGGDYVSNYDPLVFWQKNVRGVSLGMRSRYFNLDVSMGQAYRAVAPRYDFTSDTTNIISDTSVASLGTYKRTILGIRPVFNFGSHVEWGLNLVNGKDDPNSINYISGASKKVEESVATGTTLRMNFDHRRFILLASMQASWSNFDAGGPIVPLDTLVERYELSGTEKDMAEKFYNIMGNSGFLTMTPGVAYMPSLAMQFEMKLNYFNNYIQVMYKKIDDSYNSAGNPYLLKDIGGLFINDNIRLMSNQIYLNLYYKAFQDNLSEGKYKTDNRDFGGSVSYFPFASLPSLTLSYGNYHRNNGVDILNNPADSIFIVEDNSTNRFGLSSSYNFDVSGVRNTVTLSASNFTRNDIANPLNKTDFTIYNIGLRDRFTFPLETNINFSQSANAFGSGLSESTTDIQKIYANVKYDIKNVIVGSMISPYINYIYQTISRGATSNAGDFTRSNMAAGFYFRNPKYGTLTLRYDYIGYNGAGSYNDSIISTRYEVNF
jgi:hypothetical protein